MESHCNWSSTKILENTVHPNPKHIVNIIMVIVKQAIFSCKCQGILIDSKIIKDKISSYKNIQKYVYGNSYKKTEAFLIKWRPVSDALFLEDM